MAHQAKHWKFLKFYESLAKLIMSIGIIAHWFKTSLSAPKEWGSTTGPVKRSFLRAVLPRR